MKKVIYSLPVVLLSISLFISCSKDGDDKLLSPGKSVYDPVFIDQDGNEGTIGGTLSWTLPNPETNLDGYRIYLGENETDKNKKIGEVNKGSTSFEIPMGTEFNNFLLIVSWNSVGESTNVVGISVNDNFGDPIAQGLSFSDTDGGYRKIAGKLSWVAPAFGSEVTGYVIYTSDGPEEKETKLGEVIADSLSFDVPDGTAFKSYLLVANKYASGESGHVASISVTDLYTISGFYILNSGNEGENNASVDYYDFGVSELKTGVYKAANGTNLGDSAVQILAYGSKRYITVPGSNQLVITDTNNKLVKNIEPKQGNTSMTPSYMAADNGKIYISYYNGHSIAVLDTASLEVKNTVTVGHYPEQLTLANGKIYVANSGKGDAPNYGKTVSVIGQSSLTLEKEIGVSSNPSQIASGSQGHIYVLSMNNDSINGTLQSIDATTNTVNTIGYGMGMTLVNNNLYVMEAPQDSSGITIKKYDALTSKVLLDNFITDETVITNPGAIAVDPLTEKVYISEADTKETSSVFVFTSEGKLDNTIETGGFNTRWITFMMK